MFNMIYICTNPQVLEDWTPPPPKNYKNLNAPLAFSKKNVLRKDFKPKIVN